MEAIKPQSDLILQQQELENEMTMMGVEAFRQKTKGAVEKGIEDRTVYGASLLDNLLPKVVGELEALIAARSGGKAGRRGQAFKFLKLFEGRLDAAAFIALRMVISSLSSQDVKFNTLSVRIGRALEDEHHYGSVREQDKKLYEYLRDEAKKKFATHVKRKVVNYHLSKRGMDKNEPWPEKAIAVLGATVVEAIINTTGLIEKKTVITFDKGKQRVTFVVATEATRKWIAERSASAEVMRPIYEPMIVEPAEWSSPYNGGYLTSRVRPVRFVKTHQRGYLQSLEDLDLDDVYASVNAAQRTAWAINPFILTALNIAWDKDYSLGGIPPKNNTEEPPKPHDIEENEEARKAWRKEAHQVFMENREMDGKRIGFLQTLNTANRYQLFPAIYMPYQLDFRGRIYAVPRLNPQGPDWMKALLMFAEGKPLDEESAHFLAIQVANTGAFDKIDKAPLGERVQWVYDNEDKIVACAENPFDNRWWTEADSPYCFLAACREWAGWLREGEGFISHLPVALDGSCSGIQHFSMALADEVGGAAVNLVPSEKPADIYSLVMAQAIEQVRLDASTCGDNQAVAQAWLRSGLLNRSCFKRPTMTYGYGSSQFGFRDQIESDTLRPVYRAYQRGEGPWYFEDNGFKASLYLAKITQQAVERTVVKAAECMAWLKDTASVVTSEGLPVRWTTPDGFPVVQHYREQKAHRVDTMIFGSRVMMTITEEAKDKNGKPMVSRRKQASGLSPNFVHSLDATHLRMAVLQASLEGIKDVALVHDSFGTHAADTGRFFVILREALVTMYTETDVIADFAAQMKGQLSPDSRDKLPKPPTHGTLDRAAVIDSDFAFA
ncbi:DNA-directed RNA polymerase [Shimia sp.]|uniref:DNA-directed RNA polymerase n=1 Tax=Shimia sp. TaxID=1954381 RepID=UPI003BAD36B0